MIQLDGFRVVVRRTNGDAASVVVKIEPSGERIRWSVETDEPVAVDAVAFEWDAGAAGDDPRMFVQGYQSWAPTRTRRLGIDRDPSLDPRPIPLVRAAFHADPGVVSEGELRSEQVAVLVIDRPHMLCIGFAGGARHAGTIRARIVNGRVIVRAEAWLGGAILEGVRELHDVVVSEGDEPGALLLAWATMAGRAEGARVDAPFQIGWCSWYHYFHDVTEAHIRDNLARAGDWPFDVFQVDDGYQHEIGDWLRANDKFPGGIDALAHDVGPRALRIEHIGSTSVPGLAAKPIVDILVVVEDADDEDAFRGALVDAGYLLRVREPGHRMFRTDPRDVHVHVYGIGAQDIDEYIVFRDWLRTHPDDRAKYEAVKRALSEREWPDMQDYADAKTDVVEDIKRRAYAARAR